MNDIYTKNSVRPQERIDSSTGQIMVATALGFDFFQGIISAIPIIGIILTPLISLAIFLTFWLWLKLHSVSIVDNIERIVLMFGGFLIELVPILNILPAWTLIILTTILLVQNKDKRKIRDFYKNIKTSQRT